MKFRIRTILVGFVALALCLTVVVRFVTLPKSIVNLRDALSRIDLNCPRAKLMKELKIIEEPATSTLFERNTTFLLETWKLESNYRLVIFYSKVDGKLIYQNGVIFGSDGNIIPASGRYTSRGLEFLQIHGEHYDILLFHRAKTKVRVTNRINIFESHRVLVQ